MKYLCLADLHLTGNKPECRIDDEDWMGVLEDKIQFIAQKAREVDALLIAGDIFDSWRNTNFDFVNQCIVWFRYLKDQTQQKMIYSIAGNHDCPHHSYEAVEINRSPYMTLVQAGIIHDVKLNPIPDMDVYCYTDTCILAESAASICVAHKGLYQTAKPFPGAPESGNVEVFVKNLPSNIRYVVSGDYHTPFHQKVGNVDVINCGSLLRRRADQINYQPVLWILDTDAEEISQEPIPLRNKIRRDYIDNENAREDMLNEIVGSVDGDFEVTLNYRDNFIRMAQELPDAKRMIALFERMVGL